MPYAIGERFPHAFSDKLLSADTSLLSAPFDCAALLQAALDAVTAHVAVLDECATIILANAAWRRFAEANGFHATNHGIGMNYLDVCEAAVHTFAELAVVSRGIRAVLGQQVDEFVSEYHCDGPGAQHWFRMRVTSFRYAGSNYAIVSHEPLNETKQAEEKLRQALGEGGAIEGMLAARTGVDARRPRRRIEFRRHRRRKRLPPPGLSQSRAGGAHGQQRFDPRRNRNREGTQCDTWGYECDVRTLGVWYPVYETKSP